MQPLPFHLALSLSLFFFSPLSSSSSSPHSLTLVPLFLVFRLTRCTSSCVAAAAAQSNTHTHSLTTVHRTKYMAKVKEETEGKREKKRETKSALAIVTLGMQICHSQKLIDEHLLSPSFLTLRVRFTSFYPCWYFLKFTVDSANFSFSVSLLFLRLYNSLYIFFLLLLSRHSDRFIPSSDHGQWIGTESVGNGN